MWPALITVDVSSAFGVFTSPSTEDVLRDISPLGTVAPQLVTEICHTVLEPLARIVAVANLAVTERERMIQVQEAFGEYLFAVYPSYELGVRKPSREFWAEIASRHNTIVERIVHIGGCWTEDALGPSESGARAVWIGTSPPPRPDATGRVHIATSLLDAAQLVGEMRGGEGSHERGI